MKRLIQIVSGIILLGIISSNAIAQRAIQQPTNYFSEADELTLNDVNQMHTAYFSAVDTVVYVKFLVDPEYMYYFTSTHSGSGDELEVKMRFYHESDTTFTTGDILKRNTDGRASSGNFRFTGWTPPVVASTGESLGGYYYLRMFPGVNQTGEFKLRYFRTKIEDYAFNAEPNNTPAEALANIQNTLLPTDGLPRRFMLFSSDSTKTNPPNAVYQDLIRIGEDDRDLFIIQGIEGQRLEIETIPHLGFQFDNEFNEATGLSRDTDTAIRLWDADFTEVLSSNDDISGNDPARVVYPRAGNIYSRVVIPSLPYSGIYFLEVVGWASTSWSPARFDNDNIDDRDPGRGDYLVFAQMTEDGFNEVEPNNTPDQATQIFATNENTFKGNFSSSSDVDYYRLFMTEHIMYNINTANSTVSTDIKVEIYDVNDLSVNLAEGLQLGRYGNNDFRLTGFVPPATSAYVIRLSSDSAGDYELRVGFNTIPNLGLTFEPNNSISEALLQDPVPVDSTIIRSMIWPLEDVDYFYFDGIQGDNITVGTRSFYDGWDKDFDTYLRVLDASGNVIAENDDGAGVGVYSTITFVVPQDGIYFAEVSGLFSQFNNRSSTLANRGVGSYNFFVFSELSGGPLVEQEPNDFFSQATPLKSGDVMNATFSSSEDIDIFKVELKEGFMYNFRSIDSELGGNMFVEFYSAADTTLNLHDGSDWHGRYGNGDFKIAAYIPTEDQTYYIKLNAPDNVGLGNYRVLMRETDIRPLINKGEPNNTIQEADLNGPYPMDNFPRTYLLYNPEDEKFNNDVDIFRLDIKEGQVVEMETFPVGESVWIRDTDTYIDIVDANGEVLQSNDDGGIEWYSKLTRVAQEDETVYLRVLTSRHELRGSQASDRDPARGDYILTVSAFMSESEPNNTPETANMMLVSDNNLMHASFNNDDLVDYFYADLETDFVYFINTTESNVSQNIQVEVFFEDDLDTNLIDETPFGRYSNNDFMLAFIPQNDGRYYFKLSVPPTGVVDNNSEYKFRISQSPISISESATIFEPNNTLQQAEALGNVLAETNLFEIVAGTSFLDDVDFYMFQSVEGQHLRVETFPANGERWVRDYDTIAAILDADGNVLASNDDKSNPLIRELFGTGDIYSKAIVEQAPYTGTYYAVVYPFNGGYNERTPTFGRPDIGPYRLEIEASQGTSTNIEDEEFEVPISFELRQNYPNPFNPTTNIQYSIPEGANVRLTVYNYLGQVVARLVDNQYQGAGTYTIQFDARRLASGMYLYRLQADNHVTVRKMTLIK